MISQVFTFAEQACDLLNRLLCSRLPPTWVNLLVIVFLHVNRLLLMSKLPSLLTCWIAYTYSSSNKAIMRGKRHFYSVS